jgi:nucleoside-diphosphate-sugar epimerase
MAVRRGMGDLDSLGWMIKLNAGQSLTRVDLERTVIEVVGKRLTVRYRPGPIGVWSRNFSKARIKSLGWEARVSLREGIARTYPWIEAQVRALRVAR